jgi:dihydropteroate synthase/2-amino-4-hydroxy-6-hydroxymethyldihydropteridine diphosphokinase
MVENPRTIYLALGTNLGNRAANLRAALAGLPPEVRVRRVSPVYETEPWGYQDQPAFLNLVVEAETHLSPQSLLLFLKRLETVLGRQPTFRNGPRLIDLDILFYEDQVVETENLVVPHPGIANRVFVLVPLVDLAPGLVHPSLKRPVRDLLAEIDHGGVRRVMTKIPPFGTRTFVMGIINVTPDSFSGDGVITAAGLQDLSSPPDPIALAVEQARRFVAAGVDILDVGGESTRPGALPVPMQEEMDRVIPVIEALAGEFDALISVDTYKASVADAALRAGADWVNDIWGLRADPGLGMVIAGNNAPVVLMHNRIKPATTELQERLGGRYVGAQYDNLLGEIKDELLQSVTLARAAGIPDEHIILDPGIGFGKTVEQNLELIDRLGEVCALGYPVLLGPSRKSFIGYTLDFPPDQRMEGTAAAVAVGIARGADIIRVHDVEYMLRVARMSDAIVRRGKRS